MNDKDEPLRLGGMALRNGLLVHGPSSWAAAVRDRHGEVRTASGPKPRMRGPIERLPLARGPVRLGEAMLVIPLVKKALPEARLPFQDVTVLGAMAGASLAGTLLRKRRPGPGTDVAVAAISIVPSLIALRGGELAQYHGAEHKTIGAYEQDAADARATAKEHDRCGSHLMAPMLAANLAGTALLRRVVEQPRAVHGALVGVGAIGVAVEVFAWSERHGDSRAADLLRRPGHELQRLLGTREPDDRQLEVGRAALEAILRAESR